MYWYPLCQQLDWYQLIYKHSRRKVPLANRLVFCLSPCLLVKTSQPQSLRFFGQKILRSTQKIQDPWLSQGMYFGMVSSLRRMSTVASPPNSWQWQFGGHTILRRSIYVPSLATVPGRRLTSQVMFSKRKPTTLTKINQVTPSFSFLSNCFFLGGGKCFMIAARLMSHDRLWREGGPRWDHFGGHKIWTKQWQSSIAALLDSATTIPTGAELSSSCQQKYNLSSYHLWI